MIEHFRLEVDRENAFDHCECDLHTTITPSKFHEVLQTEDSATLPVFCFGDRRVEVVIKCVDEALSCGGTGGVQSLPEPEDDVSSVKGTSGNGIRSTNSRASLAKAVPLSQVGSLNAFINESAIIRAPLLPSSSL